MHAGEENMLSTMQNNFTFNSHNFDAVVVLWHKSDKKITLTISFFVMRIHYDTVEIINLPSGFVTGYPITCNQLDWSNNFRRLYD